MSSVDDKRFRAAAEIERLRQRVENEVGRPARLARWAAPIAATLGGLALAMVVKRSIRSIGQRRPSGEDLKERPNRAGRTRRR